MTGVSRSPRGVPELLSFPTWGSRFGCPSESQLAQRTNVSPTFFTNPDSNTTECFTGKCVVAAVLTGNAVLLFLLNSLIRCERFLQTCSSVSITFTWQQVYIRNYKRYTNENVRINLNGDSYVSLTVVAVGPGLGRFPTGCVATKYLLLSIHQASPLSNKVIAWFENGSTVLNCVVVPGETPRCVQASTRDCTYNIDFGIERMTEKG